MSSVPFSINSDFESFTELQQGLEMSDMVYVKGIVRFEQDVLTLEYSTVNSFTGRKSSEIEEVHLPLEELVSVDFKKRMVGTSLKVRTRTLKALEPVPGNRGGEVTLRFTRRYRNEAQELSTLIALRISERKLERLDEEMRDLNDDDDL